MWRDEKFVLLRVYMASLHSRESARKVFARRREFFITVRDTCTVRILLLARLTYKKMRNNASRDCLDWRNFHGLLYPTTSAWPAAGGDIIAARNHAAEPEGIPRLPPPLFNPRSSFLLRPPFALSYLFRHSLTLARASPVSSLCVSPVWNK